MLKISVPGRVNLIGEHIDYHKLPVLPIAIGRRIDINFQPTSNGGVHIQSEGYGERHSQVGTSHKLLEDGDWANYINAAILAVQARWDISKGIESHICSDLPPAAGLSSSSALITAVTLALLRANGIQAGLEELMSVLPEGEQFVGTRGGGMDHAAVLGSRAGFASLIHFAPFAIRHVRIPSDWRFLIAHSMVYAEKSGAARARYNACRINGINAVTSWASPDFMRLRPIPLPCSPKTNGMPIYT